MKLYSVYHDVGLIPSLPARERGLKQDFQDAVSDSLGSLPARERGLKPDGTGYLQLASESLPARERGLKLIEISNIGWSISRSPRGSVD